MKPTYANCAQVTSVQDGDTFSAIIDCGYGLTLYRYVRIKGYDAPEADGPDPAAARQAYLALAKLLPPGAQISLSRHGSGYDRYGRVLADVYLRDGTPILPLLPQEYRTSRRGRPKGRTP